MTNREPIEVGTVLYKVANIPGVFETRAVNPSHIVVAEFRVTEVRRSRRRGGGKDISLTKLGGQAWESVRAHEEVIRRHYGSTPQQAALLAINTLSRRVDELGLQIGVAVSAKKAVVALEALRAFDAPKEEVGQ